MKLYFDVKSPFARKPIVLLHEAGTIDSVELVPAAGTPIDPGSFPTAANPLGKIPVLERKDGPGLYDSRVICRFINDHFGCSLYPEPPKLWGRVDAGGHGRWDHGCGSAHCLRIPMQIRRVAQRRLDGRPNGAKSPARSTRLKKDGSDIWMGRWILPISPSDAHSVIWTSGMSPEIGGPDMADSPHGTTTSRRDQA